MYFIKKNLFYCAREVEKLANVIVGENESFESAIKRFKKEVEKAGILSEIKRHQHFEKPSEKKKRKLNATKRKMQKKSK